MKYVILEKAELRGKPGLMLRPSKDPRKKRWMRVMEAPKGYKPKRVKLQDVKDAERAYLNAITQYGENNMETQRREIRYRDLKRQWDEQKAKAKIKATGKIQPVPPEKHPELVATAINLRFREEIRKYGYTTILGKQVNNPEELADLCKIYRNPLYETQRIIMLNDDNVVVGITGISIHHPRETEAFLFPVESRIDPNLDKSMKILKGKMERLGATKYYLQHNHPSGKVVPSGQDAGPGEGGDVPLSKLYAEELPGFVGSMVINHKKFAMIDAKGKVTYSSSEAELETMFTDAPQEPDPLRKPYKAHDILGKRIKNQFDIFQVVKSYQLNKEGYYVILTRTKDGISGVAEIPKEYFNNVDKAEKAVMRYALMGGGEPFVYGAKITDPVVEKLMEREVIRDAVDEAGESWLYTYGGTRRYEWNPPRMYITEEEMKKAMRRQRSQRFFFA